jgi:protein TonB
MQRAGIGGQVQLRFVVDASGYPVNLCLLKSVEFNLDEAALEVIRESPKWVPAFQNGRNVKAYRVQPITFPDR